MSLREVDQSFYLRSRKQLVAKEIEAIQKKYRTQNNVSASITEVVALEAQKRVTENYLFPQDIPEKLIEKESLRNRIQETLKSIEKVIALLISEDAKISDLENGTVIVKISSGDKRLITFHMKGKPDTQSSLMSIIVPATQTSDQLILYQNSEGEIESYKLCISGKDRPMIPFSHLITKDMHDFYRMIIQSKTALKQFSAKEACVTYSIYKNMSESPNIL